MKDESNFDFDSSFAKLLDGGYGDAPIPECEVAANYYSLEPMQGDVNAVLKAFFEKFAQYIVNRQLNDGGIFAEVNEEKSEADEDALTYMVLNEHLAEIMKNNKYMTQGEAHAQGEGIFMTHSDEKRGLEVMGFLEGRSIMGTIETYEAAPLISYDDFIKIQKESRSGSIEDAEISTVPGVWLVLKDATLHDLAGMVETQYDSLKVPLNYPSLKFSKVYRQDTIELAKDKSEQYVDVMAHLAGDLTLELFEDFEDELNYQASKKDFSETLETIQKTIDNYMKVIDQKRLIELSATAAWDSKEDIDELKKVLAHYIRTTPQFNNGTWSIVHEFIFDTEDGDGTKNFVLPAHIQSADYLNQD